MDMTCSLIVIMLFGCSSITLTVSRKSFRLAPTSPNASILPTVDSHSTPVNRQTEKPYTVPSPALNPIEHDPLEGPSVSELITSGESVESLTTSLRTTREAFSAVTKFLTIPSSTIKSSSGKDKGKGKGKAISRARVLTSVETLAHMEEKENLMREKEVAEER